jgi:hypothetical protein
MCSRSSFEHTFASCENYPCLGSHRLKTPLVDKEDCAEDRKLDAERRLGDFWNGRHANILNSQ